MRRILIGIGNQERTDDGVGLVVADRLKDRFDAVVKIRLFLPEDLLSLRGYDEAVIIDGAFGIPEGEVRRYRVDDLPCSKTLTHIHDIGNLLRLGEMLYRDFPKKITIFGIGITDTRFGDQLTERMKGRLDRICQDILELL
ncbi:hypothetical protein DRP53_00715 [candidate division WOR-3 bacterium]|uniref:Hydrogenase maturation protease n=1 Tax=candidate division WOR-3 bacterium TaxID=2052148 RepID=A0A660SMD0_UNCW3|nr:MAG: hypothetical protein DRP53_00715 [candidate division WOR-3 bacterium]